ncbi:spore germination protein GerW family protein [uncultured Clostridium sp.]|uniref:GerW family sporulation protein n=1 Tax=uncultured Clostridium sp. TaxID=59620 RepID=UPI0028EA3AB8|nr:spore germination protein GerW family protein [uncultured Clostridium sp.]
MEKNTIKENMDSIFEKLEKFLKTETVVGEPKVIGEVTLVPIISVSFGGGTGGGSGLHNNGVNGEGFCGGVGARISPITMVVIKKDEVSMLPIREEGNLDNLLNMVPDIISKINEMKDKKENNKNEK